MDAPELAKGVPRRPPSARRRPCIPWWCPSGTQWKQELSKTKVGDAKRQRRSSSLGLLWDSVWLLVCFTCPSIKSGQWAHGTQNQSRRAHSHLLIHASTMHQSNEDRGSAERKGSSALWGPGLLCERAKGAKRTSKRGPIVTGRQQQRPGGGGIGTGRPGLFIVYMVDGLEGCGRSPSIHCGGLRPGAVMHHAGDRPDRWDRLPQTPQGPNTARRLAAERILSRFGPQPSVELPCCRPSIRRFMPSRQDDRSFHFTFPPWTLTQGAQGHGDPHRRAPCAGCAPCRRVPQGTYVSV